MSGAWVPLSDDDEERDWSDGELEYDMWEGQFDLFAINENNDNFAERFNLDFTLLWKIYIILYAGVSLLCLIRIY